MFNDYIYLEQSDFISRKGRQDFFYRGSYIFNAVFNKLSMQSKKPHGFLKRIPD